jgi:hypothetical protein
LTRFAELLRALASADVEFILAGGVAAAAHGSARSTQDVDVVYGRSEQNLQRLVSALGACHPYLRGAPPGLPFRFNLETLKAGLNFTLTTDLGWIDLSGGIPGGGCYEDLDTDPDEAIRRTTQRPRNHRRTGVFAGALAALVRRARRDGGLTRAAI